MKPKRIILMAMTGVLLTTNAALANNPPSGQTLLSMISILPLMIIFSMMGGAYTVLKQLVPNGFSRGFLIGGIAVAIIFSMVHEGFAVIVAVIFGIYAIVRGFMMLGWGLTALARKEKPPHLLGASPGRLIPSGLFLIPVTVFLVGVCIVFCGRYVSEHQYREIETALKEFVIHQVAYAHEQKTKTGRCRFDEAARDVYLKAYPDTRIEYSPDGNHFSVVIPPRNLPVFPYYYMTAAPTYRADETGQIRMMRVRWKDQLCPADAPVIMKLQLKHLPQPKPSAS